jgi:hypothetical protein
MMAALVNEEDSSVFQLAYCHNLHFLKGGCDFDEARA